MKYLAKCFALFLALMMLVSFVPLSALAAEAAPGAGSQTAADSAPAADGGEDAAASGTEEDAAAPQPGDLSDDSSDGVVDGDEPIGPEDEPGDVSNSEPAGEPESASTQPEPPAAAAQGASGSIPVQPNTAKNDPDKELATPAGDEDLVRPAGTYAVENDLDSGAGSLRAALTAAIASTDASSTITIPLSLSNQVSTEISLNSPLPDIPSGKSITVTSPATDPQLCIIARAGSTVTGNTFNVAAGGSLQLSNMELEDLTDTGMKSSLASSMGTFTATNVNFVGGGRQTQFTIYGGGLDVSGGTATLTKVLFMGNCAQDGGGLAVRGTASVTVKSGEFDANAAISSNGRGSGGGIYLAATATLNLGSAGNTVQIRCNRAGLDGGGLYSEGGNLTFAGNVIVGGEDPGVAPYTSPNAGDGNEAKYDGGGICLRYGETDTTSKYIKGVTIQNNRAGWNGGGVYVYGKVLLSFQAGTRILDNKALGTATASVGNGGGIYCAAAGTGGIYTSLGSIDGAAVTLAGNRAARDGGGIWQNAGTMNIGATAVIGGANAGAGTSADPGDGNVAAGFGGGVYNATTNIFDMNGTVKNNVAARGGGVYIPSSTFMRSIDATIEGNKATSLAQATPGVEFTSTTQLYLSGTTVIDSLYCAKSLASSLAILPEGLSAGARIVVQGSDTAGQMVSGVVVANKPSGTLTEAEAACFVSADGELHALASGQNVVWDRSWLIATPVMTLQSAAHDSIQVSWNAVAGADGYEIENATSSSGPFTPVRTVTDGSTSWTHTGLTTARNQFYRMRAYTLVNGAKQYSAYTAEQYTMPLPAAPSVSATGRSPADIYLEWTAAAGAGSYTVERATSQAGPWTEVKAPYPSDTNLVYRDTGLTPSSTYYYRVCAVAYQGSITVPGPYSAIVSAKAGIGTPANFKLTKENPYQFALSWNSVPWANGYELWRATQSSGPYTVVVSRYMSMYTDYDLVDGQVYYYRMRAYENVSGTTYYSGYTPVVSNKAGMAAPGSMAATAVHPDDVKLSWGAVAGAELYNVERATAASGPWVVAADSLTDRTYTDTNLTSGTTYYYRVRGKMWQNSAAAYAYGPYSAVVSARPVFAAPAGLAVSTTATSAKLTWKAVAAAWGYEVWRSTTSSTSGFEQIEYIQNKATTSYTDTGLAAGKTYYYRVRAWRWRGGEEIFSLNSAITARTLPAKPGSFKAASASYNSVKLTWSKPAGASGYEVQRATGSGSYKTVKTITSGSTLSYKNGSLKTGTSYKFRVRAYRLVGGVKKYGAYTAAKTAKPVPAKVAGAKATAGSKKVALSWKAVSGASGYEVRRATSKGGTYKTVKTVKGGKTVKFTNAKLTPGKKYYYKVRAYRTVNGKKVYGAYSTVVSAKAL